MKNLILFFLISFLLPFFSCSNYIPLTKEKYRLLNRDGNCDKISAKFLQEIPIDFVTKDSIFTEVDSKGTAKFNYEKRKIKPIPAGSKIKIIETKETSFLIEFVDYKLQFEMYLDKNNEWIIRKDKSLIVGTEYKTSVINPELVFKYKRKNRSREISLKK